MCPQQGHWLPFIEGTLNVEVTVTGSGGYVTEDPMSIDAQITIQPKLWFSPDTMQNNSLIKKLWQLFESNLISFPSSKGNPIKLNGYGVNQQDQPVKTPWLNISNGMDPNYPVPDFAKHDTPDEYGNKKAVVVYLGVEIGEVVPSTNPIKPVADFENWFNGIIMDLFNLATGNLLQYQNVLSWNVWALAPEDVYTPEWQQHADYWRFSIDVNHRSPEGNGRDPQYFNGTPFSPVKAAICNKLEELKNGIANSVFGNTPIAQDIIAELNNIIAKNCGG
jgi:hypothetical protein